MNPESKLTLPTAIVVAGILIAGAVLLNNSTPAKIAGVSDTKAPGPEAVSVPLAPVTTDDYILGNPDAKVVIIEFSDYECPYCKMFHKTMQQIIAEYGKTGAVAWVYRQFPLDQIHSKARTEAAAAFCAGDLGGTSAFWKYSDTIFANTPSNNGLDLTLLPKFASGIGLNVDAFNACLKSDKFKAKIQNHLEQGLSAGARGTPYSIVMTKDGKQYPINGAQPYETVKAMIDTILSTK
jgi:protein-disulfide isomerase